MKNTVINSLTTMPVKSGCKRFLFEPAEEKKAELANVLNDDHESGDELDNENCLCFLIGLVSSREVTITLNPKLHVKNLISNLDSCDYVDEYEGSILL